MSAISLKPSRPFTLLGVNCNAVTIPELLTIFERAVRTDQPNVIVGNHNIHSIYLCRREPLMRRFYEITSVTYIDSMPMIFLGKLLGLPLERKHRTAFLDWHRDFMSLAESRNWRIFYVGGRPESLAKASKLMASQFPDLSIRFHHGYFGDSDLPSLYDKIREFQPHVLLVGMGMPRQENWIVAALEHVRVNCIVNGGAMIEYMIGEQTATPRWIGQLGLEWLFRLATQPRRLARRYLLEPFFLLDLVAHDFGAAWKRSLRRRARGKQEQMDNAGA